MVQRSISVIIGLFFMWGISYEMYGAARELPFKKRFFEKYFASAYLPYKDPNLEDIVFWCYYPGVDVTNCCISEPFIGLYRVVSTPLFIKHLKEFARKSNYNDLYAMTRLALEQYVKEKDGKKPQENLKACLTLEEDIIKIFKAEKGYRPPEDAAALYITMCGQVGSKELSLEEYLPLAKKHLKEQEYEGSFICITPKLTQAFCAKVEKAMNGKMVKWTAVERDEDIEGE